MEELDHCNRNPFEEELDLMAEVKHKDLRDTFLVHHLEPLVDFKGSLDHIVLTLAAFVLVILKVAACMVAAGLDLVTSLI